MASRLLLCVALVVCATCLPAAHAVEVTYNISGHLVDVYQTGDPFGFGGAAFDFTTRVDSVAGLIGSSDFGVYRMTDYFSATGALTLSGSGVDGTYQNITNYAWPTYVAAQGDYSGVFDYLRDNLYFESRFLIQDHEVTLSGFVNFADGFLSPYPYALPLFAETDDVVGSLFFFSDAELTALSQFVFEWGEARCWSDPAPGSVIPEPATAGLIAASLAGMLLRGRRRRGL